MNIKNLSANYLFLSLIIGVLISVISCTTSETYSSNEDKKIAINQQNDSLLYLQLLTAEDSAIQYLDRKEYVLALPLFLNTLQYCRKLKNIYQFEDSLELTMSWRYYRTAFCYHFLEDTENASFYLEMANQSLSGKNNQELKLMADIKNIWGNVYALKDDIEQALAFFQESLTINKSLSVEPTEKIGDNYVNMGFQYAYKGKFTEAFDMYEKALKIYTNLDLPLKQSITYGKMEITYGLMNDIQAPIPEYSTKAVDCGKKAVSFVYKATNPTTWDLCQAHLRLASAHNQSHDFETALAQIQIALSYYANEDLIKDLHYTPKFEKEEFSLDIIRALFNKAGMLKNRYAHNSSDLQDLLTGYKIYAQIFPSLDHVIHSYDETNSKLINIEDIYNIYDEAVINALILYAETRDQFYLNRVLELIDRSKSMLLEEKLMVQHALELAPIPQNPRKDLVKIKQRIQENQSLLETDLLSPLERNDTIKSLLNDKLIYYELYQKIRKKYPHTNIQTPYKKEILSIKDIQEALPPSTALIEYMIEKWMTYSLTITPDTVFYHTVFIPRKQIREKVDKIQLSIDVNHPDIDSYAATAFELYQKFIAPVEGVLKNTRQLYLVTDDALNELPFKALLTEKVEEAAEFDIFTPHFLMQRYQISRGLSASLLFDRSLSNQNKATKGILSISPYNKAVQEWYSEHGRTRDEAFSGVERAKKRRWYGNSKSLIGMKAQKERVLNEMPYYRILDFAGTHGISDTQNPQKSHVILAPPSNYKDTTDFYLYLSEIYHQKLQAELVTLPVCETGKGTFRKGEGTISLARAFKYAGVPSIMMTLWSVQDAPTGEITDGFYKNLRAGEDKSTALQQAQIAYLNQHAGSASNPYYWAGIVLIGNDSPLEIPPLWISWKFWGIVIGIAALLIALVINSKTFINYLTKQN